MRVEWVVGLRAGGPRGRGWRGRSPVPWRCALKSVEEAICVPMRAILGAEPPSRIEIGAEELEALKLVYLDDLTLDEAAAGVGVSRTTLWRALESALRYRRPCRLLSTRRYLSSPRRTPLLHPLRLTRRPLGEELAMLESCRDVLAREFELVRARVKELKQRLGEVA